MAKNQKRMLIMQSLSFLLLCITIMLVWHVGDQLHIAGYTPLATSLSRTVVNSLFIICWLSLILRKTKQPFIFSSRQAKTRAMLTLLNHRFYGAIHFLKRTSTKSKTQTNHLYDLPWYLVIGPPGSGKTTLLAKSGLSFSLAKQQNNIQSTELCDWWVSREAVFLDTTGQFCPTTKYMLHYKILWHRLLQLIKEQGQTRLNGIILVLDLPGIAKLPHNKKLLLYHNIRSNLAVVKKCLPTEIPVYLICNQCDRILGFQEFFADLGKEEQQQIWGTTLANSYNIRQRSLLTIVKKEFSALLMRLHERLLWRLHHERNQQTRLLIKDFPVQLDMLSKQILLAIKQMANTSKLLWLRGIYLTSSTQTNDIEDYVLSTVQKNLNLPDIATHRLQTVSYHQPTALFSKHFLQQLLQQDQHLVSKNNAHLIKTCGRHTTIISVSIIVFYCAFTWSQQLNQYNKRIVQIEKTLANYQVLTAIIQKSTPTDVNHDTQQSTRHRVRLILPALNAAQSATDMLSTVQLTRLTRWLSNNHQQLYDNVQQLYQQALVQLLTPEIMHIVYTKLLNTHEYTSADFYSDLEVYLMLGQPKHLNYSLVHAWLNAYWQQLFPDDETIQQQLKQHTSNWLAGTLEPIKLDDTLLAKIHEEIEKQQQNS